MKGETKSEREKQQRKQNQKLVSQKKNKNDKREMTQITNSRSGIRDINTDPIDIKRIIREDYNRFMAIYLTDEMDKFPDRRKLLKLTQEETENKC